MTGTCVKGNTVCEMVGTCVKGNTVCEMVGTCVKGNTVLGPYVKSHAVLNMVMQSAQL